MRIHLLAIGTRMPSWVKDGFDQYASRMPGESRLILKEVVSKVSKNDSPENRVELEYKALLASMPQNCLQITLDRLGKHWDTQRLSQEFDGWLHSGKDVAIVIGGADGLPQRSLSEAHSSWSLSNLTLPHMLVRVIFAEQLYRAYSLLSNHPYHRK